MFVHVHKLKRKTQGRNENILSSADKIKYNKNDQAKEHETDRACSTCEEEKEHVQGFGAKERRRESTGGT
jgi:hypothetical protein